MLQHRYDPVVPAHSLASFMSDHYGYVERAPKVLLLLFEMLPFGILLVEAVLAGFLLCEILLAGILRFGVI